MSKPTTPLRWKTIEKWIKNTKSFPWVWGNCKTGLEWSCRIAVEFEIVPKSIESIFNSLDFKREARDFWASGAPKSVGFVEKILGRDLLSFNVRWQSVTIFWDVTNSWNKRKIIKFKVFFGHKRIDRMHETEYRKKCCWLGTESSR